MKACAAAVHVLRFNFSAMGLDDGADNGQTHSQAFLFSGKELLEQPLSYFIGNTDPIVSHRNPDRFNAISFGSQFHLPSGDWNVAHGLTCIRDEIDQHLLDLDWIAFYHRQILRE